MTRQDNLPVAVPGWARPHGYADGMQGTGRIVVTAGVIGWNPETQEIETDNFGSQVAQCLRNIVAILAAAGAAPTHLVRLTWYVTNRDEYIAARPAIGLAYREVLGRHYPVMAVVVVAGLLEPRAKVEIEAMAIVPQG
ncbi:MAG: RidA family protein [Gemmatimonadaceae bacterium]|nr:RidA family protein [Gemmatimonadaceae bacterium]